MQDQYLSVPWIAIERGGELVCRVTTPFPLLPWGLYTTIPEGFESDGMSVPRAFWSWIGPRIAPRTIGPCIAHDWLYISHDISRKAADKFLRRTLEGNGYPTAKAWMVYVGVRAGGAFHW